MSTTTEPRTFSVPGISCGHCKSAIESAVGAVAGVESVGVGIGAKSVAVVGGSDPDVVAAIDDAGYDVA